MTLLKTSLPKPSWRSLAAALALTSLAVAQPGESRRPVHKAAAAASGAMLPARLLECRIGHVINFDPSKEQTAAELRYDGLHDFALYLPEVPVRSGPPPEAYEPPEPVNPRTRIVRDPDGIAPQPGHHFEKVVDMWPDRVELASTIAGPLLNVIVIHPVDVAGGTANLFMTRASELTHFDAGHIYQGGCKISKRSDSRRAA